VRRLAFLVPPRIRVRRLRRRCLRPRQDLLPALLIRSKVHARPSTVIAVPRSLHNQAPALPGRRKDRARNMPILTDRGIVRKPAPPTAVKDRVRNLETLIDRCVAGKQAGPNVTKDRRPEAVLLAVLKSR
jgi:hypothetical protein